MQTPAGYTCSPDPACGPMTTKLVLTNFWAAVFNPSTLPRFFHTVAACYVAGAFFLVGVAAWYLLRGHHLDVARLSLRLGIVVAFLGSGLMFVSGDLQTREVAAYQPLKFAAMEGVCKTGTSVELAIFGIPPSQDCTRRRRDAGRPGRPEPDDELQSQQPDQGPGSAARPVALAARRGPVPRLPHDGRHRRADAAAHGSRRPVPVATIGREPPVVAEAGGPGHSVADPGHRGRLDGRRGGPPAVDRLRPDEDFRRGLARRLRHGRSDLDHRHRAALRASVLPVAVLVVEGDQSRPRSGAR